MTETFRPWPTDMRYLVGDLGTIVGPSGRAIGSVSRDGYIVVAYRTAEGRRTSTTAHAMVCETYHGPRPPGREAAHDDGVPGNNAAANLRWDTPTGNARDRIRHGTNGGLTAEAVREIRATVGESSRVVALRYGVAPATVRHVRHGRTWSQVPASTSSVS